MSESPKHEKRLFTWSDYQTWPGEERWEIIGGVAYAMSPSPTFRHQVVTGEILAVLTEHFRGKKCRALGAPLDVKFSEQDVVQPDVLVVCDRSKIKATHIEGAPTLVVEVVSPSSEVHDRRDKLALYAQSGVPEYWIVTPYPSLVEVYALEGGSYRVAAVYRKEETLTSVQFPDLSIDLATVFDFPLEPGEEEIEAGKMPPMGD